MNSHRAHRRARREIMISLSSLWPAVASSLHTFESLYNHPQLNLWPCAPIILPMSRSSLLNHIGQNIEHRVAVAAAPSRGVSLPRRFLRRNYETLVVFSPDGPARALRQSSGRPRVRRSV